MTEPSRRPRVDPMRAVVFRDVARDIVRKDRDDRRDGRSVDTAGAIARALERAYRLGFEEAKGEPGGVGDAPIGDVMAWELVPRRPRSVVLWPVCLALLGDGTRPEIEGKLVPAKLPAGGPGWHLVGTAPGIGRVYAERDVMVLRRLGLLGAGGGEHGGLTLTARAKATWRMAVDAAGGYPNP